jgi:hypothetical protein
VTRIYDRAVTSSGMTLDTPRGPVDLVAVERVLGGHYAPLTRADDTHLSDQLTGSWDQAAWVSEALGVDMLSVLRRVDRARKRAAAMSP